jgi:hypothetical protein
MALEKVIRDAIVQARGTTLDKFTQLLAYADETDIIGTSEKDLKKTFTAFKYSSD